MYNTSVHLLPEEGKLVITARSKMQQHMRHDNMEKVEWAEEISGKSASESEKNDEDISRETSGEGRLTVRDYTINHATALANIAEHYLASDGDVKTLNSAY